jgi:hypothetical protein
VTSTEKYTLSIISYYFGFLMNDKLSFFILFLKKSSLQIKTLNFEVVDVHPKIIIVRR